MRKPHPADQLAHPEVTAAISRILRSAGIRAQDMEDGVANVQVKVLKSLSKKPFVKWPQDPGAWKGLAITSTKTYLIDRWRKAARDKKKGDVGLKVEDADTFELIMRRASERHPLDHQRALQLVEQVLGETSNRALMERILEAIVNDESHVQVAEEMGLKPQQVADKWRFFRADFRAKVATVLGGGALAILGVLLTGRERPGEHRYYQHGPEVALHDATPLEVAAELRDEAKDLCVDHGNWDRCLELLNAAWRLDPEGDRSPSVQAMRDLAVQGQSDERHDRVHNPELPAHPPTPPQEP